jgi:hypothetical protein
MQARVWNTFSVGLVAGAKALLRACRASGGRHDGSGQGLPPFESLQAAPDPQSCPDESEARSTKMKIARVYSVKLAFLKPREMKWLREWTKENITDAAITVSSYDEDKNFIDAKDGWHEATDLVKQMTEHLREAKAALAEHLDHLEALRAIGVLQDELTSWTAELRAKADASTTARNDRHALRSGESGEEQMAS